MFNYTVEEAHRIWMPLGERTMCYVLDHSVTRETVEADEWLGLGNAWPIVQMARCEMQARVEAQRQRDAFGEPCGWYARKLELLERL